MNNTLEIEIKTKGADTAARDIKAVRENLETTSRQTAVASNSMDDLSSSLSKTLTSLSQTGKTALSTGSSFANMSKEAISFISSVTTSQNSMLSSSLTNQYNSLRQENERMMNEYDKSIDEIEERYSAMKEALKEEDAKSLENLIENLESEKEISINHNDILSAYAIDKKLFELEAKKKKEDEEKAIETKRLSEIKAVEDAKTKASEKARREEAMIQYKRDKANYDNTLANSKMNAALGIADAVAQPAMAVLNVASGTAKSFAQGGIPGGIAGAVMGISILGTVLGSVASAVASANNIKALEANPPTKPAFAHGTMGYALKSGESAVVGEMGAELVHNRGGELVVSTHSRTNSPAVNENFTLNFYGITMNEAIEEIKDFLKTYKDRDVVYMS